MTVLKTVGEYKTRRPFFRMNPMSTLGNTRVSRRQFNQTVVAAGAAAASASFAAPAFLRGQSLNSKMNIAIIGAGGRGAADTAEVKSENIVALCDVNAHSLDSAATRFPAAKKFSDFRKMFETAEADFDAVVIATCEHTHAAATMLALKHNKHVYCEKPLTHDVWEARMIREIGGQNQGHHADGDSDPRDAKIIIRVVELVRSGVIGPVREVHVWVSAALGFAKRRSRQEKSRYCEGVRASDGRDEGAGLAELGFVDWPGGVSAVQRSVCAGTEMVSLVGFWQWDHERPGQPLERSAVLGAGAGISADDRSVRHDAAACGDRTGFDERDVSVRLLAAINRR